VGFGGGWGGRWKTKEGFEEAKFDGFVQLSWIKKKMKRGKKK
jgi:hypothetical protein